jgi:hypothetical protein
MSFGCATFTNSKNSLLVNFTRYELATLVAAIIAAVVAGVANLHHSLLT